MSTVASVCFYILYLDYETPTQSSYGKWLNENVRKIVGLDLLKNLCGPFFNCLKGCRTTTKRQFTFYLAPRSFWYSCDRLRNDEKLSRAWSQSVVLNPGLGIGNPASFSLYAIAPCRQMQILKHRPKF